MGFVAAIIDMTLINCWLVWTWLLFDIKSCLSAKDLTVGRPLIKVSKCCSTNELLDDNFHCQHVNITDSQQWEPYFSDEKGNANVQIPGFEVVSGLPNCGAHQALAVYETHDSTDKLVLLASGWLRHYIRYVPHEEDETGAQIWSNNLSTGEKSFYDYAANSYCLDKAIRTDKGLIEMQAAVICVPVVSAPWSVDFIARKVINPALHLFGIACLLAVAIIYFILPPLRDLVGNILSTISVCLIISQIADLVRIFTELTNHVSFLVADVVMYLSLLAAFFWLNSFGYYIWKTFRSRNVFLRVSDKRKYCYYSSFAWGVTLLMTFIALTSHFLFDEGSGFPVSPQTQQNHSAYGTQRTIGWLGIAMFFTPIACTILVNLFFYLTTGRAISRMATYGRIHGRMKFSFELFIQMFLVMSVAWLFLLLSWLQYDALFFAHIIVNALQPPLILLICVVGRKNVRALLRKGCCRGETEPQWGEEMMSMTSS